MKHKLSIHNFGPIGQAEIATERLLVLIGPQSSGKSTIAKLVYYFLHVRDEVLAFVLENAMGKAPPGRPDWALQKRLRNRFVEFFGPTPQPADTCIDYDYGSGVKLTITLDRTQHKYLSPVFSDVAQQRINQLLRDTANQLKPSSQNAALLTAVGRLASDQQRTTILERARTVLGSLFAFRDELLFIPAGRSLLSSLADQVQFIHPHLLDYPMRQFVETVTTSRAFFGKSLDDLVRERQALSTEPVRFSAVRRAQGYMQRILKGEYRYDKEGGKIVIDGSTFTKINYASSGQQEAVWILLSVFLLIFEQSRSFVVVEEPEAHLYPTAQKDIIEYLVYAMNAIGGQFLITTHSPYLVSCLNNLLFAHRLSSRIPEKGIQDIVPKHVWLDAANAGGYYVCNGRAEDLMARDIPALRVELLDAASDDMNGDYERLLDLTRNPVVAD